MAYTSTECAKNDLTCFCQNFDKSALNFMLFGTQIAKTIELCKVCSLLISLNLCQRSTVQSADAPNLYITWSLSVSDCLLFCYQFDRECRLM